MLRGELSRFVIGTTFAASPAAHRDDQSCGGQPTSLGAPLPLLSSLIVLIDPVRGTSD